MPATLTPPARRTPTVPSPAPASTVVPSGLPSSPSAHREAIFHEGVPFATVPLAPLFNRRTLDRAPIAGQSAETSLARVVTPAGQHGWMLRHTHGALESPLTNAVDAPVVQAELVLDVYAGLLLELAEAGFPADGKVQVGRMAFLRRINWVRQSGYPGGRLYDQLDEAIAYLYDLRITSTEIERFLDVGPHGTATGRLTYRILQAHGRVSDWREQEHGEQNRPDAGHAADDLIVFFSGPFMRALERRDQRVTYRMGHYLAFEAGTSRALYRYVSYLATQPLVDGTIAVDMNDVLASIGSARRDLTPERFQKLIGGASKMLVEKGLLRTEPTCRPVISAGRKTYQVVFRPAPPPTTELKALLRETLIAYGVWPHVATPYTEADDKVEWVAWVVAAVTLGMLETRTDLPRMVVDYCKHPERPLDADRLPRFCPTSPAQRHTNLTGNAAMTYLDESFEQNRAYLRGLAKEDLRQRREKYEAPGRPAWVVEGLMLAAARSDRQGWTLDDFLRSRGVSRTRRARRT